MQNLGIKAIIISVAMLPGIAVPCAQARVLLPGQAATDDGAKVTQAPILPAAEPTRSLSATNVEMGKAVTPAPAAAVVKEQTPPPPVPNLTINITLNSALDEKQTSFYTQIAQDLITHLPRELKLDGKSHNLTGLDPRFNHLNVVAYLPKVEGDQTDLDKVIKHFKVNFTFAPDGDTLVPVPAAGAVTAVSPTGVPVTTAILPMAEVGVPAAAPAVAASPTTAPPVPPKPEVKQFQVARGIILLAKPQEEIKPGIYMLAASLPMLSLAPYPSHTATPTHEENALGVKVPFDMDGVSLSLEGRKNLAAFARKVAQAKNVKGFAVVVRAYEGPGDNTHLLGAERLKRVAGFLRQQNLDLNAGYMKEVYIQTTGAQFISIKAITNDKQG